LLCVAPDFRARAYFRLAVAQTVLLCFPDLRYAFGSGAGQCVCAAELPCEDRHARIVCEGPESEEAESLQHLVVDPARFENFGFSRRWESSFDSVPGDASEEAFEEWLWRLKP